MKRTAYAAFAVLMLGAASFVYSSWGQTVQLGKGENPQEIQRLLAKFDQAQATAPLRYPTACIAGTALEYTQMALSAGLPGVRGADLHLWTVPEAFGRVGHPTPDRKSGRCDYRVGPEGGAGDAHLVAEFFSRKSPRTGEIAYAKVWRQGGNKAVLVAFPNGPRGANPDIRYKTVAVTAQPDVP